MIVKPSNRIGDVKTYYFATKLAEIADMNAQGHDVINLGIGSPDLLPPKEVITALQEAAENPIANKYQPYKGIPSLRKGFSGHYSEMLNVNIDPNSEVLPLIGSKEGIMHIAMSFLNPGDEVLVPNPGYPSYKVTTELAGATPIFYDLTDETNWLPNLEILSALDLSKVKLMWINYPNMPTGATITIDALKEVVNFARRNSILLCHDNPYNFILNQSPFSIFNVEGAKDCCLELYSLSKCFNMAGWRVGALIGAKDYIDVVLRFKSNMDSGMYRPIQEAATTALNLDQSWFDTLNEEYIKRRECAFAIFDLLDCTYRRDGAGLFVWAKAPTYVGDVPKWSNEILHSAKVFITPGFVFGSNGTDYLRIALCSPIEKLEKARRHIESRFIKSIA